MIFRPVGAHTKKSIFPTIHSRNYPGGEADARAMSHGPILAGTFIYYDVWSVLNRTKYTFVA